MVTDKINRKILVVDDDHDVLSTFDTILVQGEEDETRELIELLTGKLAVPHEEGAQLISEVKDSVEMHTATSATEAIEIFRQAVDEGAPFSVVFMDVRMPPGIDGLECAQQLREIDPWFYLVVVSAYSDYSVEEMSNRFENNFLYLQKPFVREELVQMSRHFSWCWSRDLQLREEVKRLKDELAETRFLLEAASN